MIELKDLRKSYTTGSFTQKALDGVSVTFRENEFVAILGPSGSGKTTLLNVLGGLDHADTGDVIVNGVSTKDYKSADWDTYRNHHIGFIFQSYNLIPHQTILSNVELALTLSGVDRDERRERARNALERVGLGDHVDKKPNQLSGGQAQRVAIARALINEPDIVLADEPTGALDTETGMQVMELLSEIAQNRLVIMVTHNPDLAHQYANRIISLSDGRITGDTHPVAPQEAAAVQRAAASVGAAAVAGAAGAGTAAARPASADEPTAQVAPAGAETAKMPPVSDAPLSGGGAQGGASGRTGTSKGRKKHSSMSFLTALSLSFANLMSKKGRTFLTAFAGSIGIIGIAAILALSNGVNNYIDQVEEETLSSYPITISKSSFDISNLMSSTSVEGETKETTDDSLISERTVVTDMFSNIKNNDLKTFKEYLQGEGDYINDYTTTITYNYGITPLIYTSDEDDPKQVSPSTLEQYASFASSSSLMSSYSSFSSFQEMIDNQEVLESQFEVVEGEWPDSYDECVLVLNSDGSISDYTLYNIGALDPDEFADMFEDAMGGDKVDIADSQVDFSYEDALSTTFKVVLASDQYEYNSSSDTWTDISDDKSAMKEVISESMDLKVVGVIKPRDTTTTASLSEGIAYTTDLTQHLMEEAADSDIVQQQLDHPKVDVFTGKTFKELNEESDFDLGSIISIDEDALTDALGLDISGSSLDSSSLTGLDTSSLLDSIDSDALAQEFADAPLPEISSDSVSLTTKQQAQLTSAASGLMVGFMTYYAEQHPNETIGTDTDLTADFQAYLAQDSVQTELSAIYETVGGAATDQVEDLMNDYLENDLLPYIEEVIAGSLEEMAAEMTSSMTEAMSSSLTGSMTGLSSSFATAMQNAISINMDEDELTQLLTAIMSDTAQSYEGNLSTLGYASEDDPESIDIYPKDFDSKELVTEYISDYNDMQEAADNDDATISYTDLMGTMISSVTDIIDMISMVLIAFVSVSLVVSSIMIAIITYISVLERRKEIGILRAMGASKGNVASIFNAETVIEGLIAGVIAIAAVLLASIPVNSIILNIYDVANIMVLPWQAALGLIAISVLLNFIAGLIPSVKASRSDPVEALRSE